MDKLNNHQTSNIGQNVHTLIQEYLLLNRSINNREKLFTDPDKILKQDTKKHQLHGSIEEIVGSKEEANWMIAWTEAQEYSTEKSKQVELLLKQKTGIDFPVFYRVVPFYYGGGTNIEKVYPNLESTIIVNIINTTYEYTSVDYAGILERITTTGETLKKSNREYSQININLWSANLHTPTPTLDISFGDKEKDIQTGVAFLSELIGKADGPTLDIKKVLEGTKRYNDNLKAKY